MENVLAAVIIIFILLFGALTLSYAFISAQQTVYNAWEDANARNETLTNTDISLEDIGILTNGDAIEVTLRNTGSLKLADFEEWDIFADYYDGSVVPAYYTGRLPYNGTPPASRWSIDGIFIDAAEAIPEGIEANILNAGEEMVLHVDVSPAVGEGQMARVTVSTPNGVSTSLIGIRNILPVVETNLPLKIASGSTVKITTAFLETTDEDNEPEELVYTIDVLPGQGTLNPEGFTQAQIDAGEVEYTHTGSGDDTFEFSVSDGIDAIGTEAGTYLFEITINTPPVLAVNAGASGAMGGTINITNAMLQTTDADADDPPGDLLYIITQTPLNGSLSLGAQFSQADVDGGSLTYTHTDLGTTADSFTFDVYDGYDWIYAQTFYFTLS